MYVCKSGNRSPNFCSPGVQARRARKKKEKVLISKRFETEEGGRFYFPGADALSFIRVCSKESLE